MPICQLAFTYTIQNQFMIDTIYVGWDFRTSCKEWMKDKNTLGLDFPNVRKQNLILNIVIYNSNISTVNIHISSF
jgi:hypothetical protein